MMRTTVKSWLCLTGLLAGMLGLLSAGEFMPPAEGPVPFRRDRIPLNVDAINALSKDLEALARGNKAKEAPGLRGAAQMLALALALNPGNADARELVSEYKEGRHVPAGNDEQKISRHTRIRQHIAWLETPEAGSDGQALAACLKDVLLLTHSQAEVAGKAAEFGAWGGWVANVSAFKTKEIVSIVKPDAPKPVVKPPPTSGILLEKATVLTSMWRMIENADAETWIPVLAPLQMTATNAASSEDAGFSIMIGNPQDLESTVPLGKTLETLLKNQLGSLPPVGQIRITTEALDQSTQFGKPQSLSAAAAVLASAALTGRTPEAIIMGQIDAAGAFTLPGRFWDRIQALDKGKGQRLVLPVDASPYLSSILAMEKPEFFLGYEVVLAADFKQLLELSAKSPEEPQASTTAKFREIRERAGTLDVRTYIDNNFVKQRLAAVLQDQPSHASAKMLLTQAAGDRPIWVSRKVLAAELQRALEPMAWIKTSAHFVFDTEVTWPPAPKDVPQVGQTYEICRPAVDRLERYARKDDMDLLTQARELVIAIRTLNKAPRFRSSNNLAIIHAVKSAHADVNRLHRALAAKLASESHE